MTGKPVFLIIFWVLIFYFFYYQLFKSKKVLEQWAADRGTPLIEKELRFVRVGPFFFRKDRAVYRIHVRDHDGELKKAWVLVGSLFFLNPNKIEVIWDSSFSGASSRRMQATHSAAAILYFFGMLLMVALLGLLFFDIDLHELFSTLARKWN